MTDPSSSFKYKVLRKHDNTCAICKQPITNTSNCKILDVFKREDILRYANTEENLFWVYDRTWEDWLVPTHEECCMKHIPKALPDHGVSTISTVIGNLKTSLGVKTNYVDTYDPSLLVPIPRSIARDGIGYEFIPFRGVDVWNAWEVSYLDRHGKPYSTVIRFGYDADSVNILESKSLKLYFNSFNNTIVDGDICEIVKEDIKKYAQASHVFVNIVEDEGSLISTKHKSIDDLILDNYLYEYSPDTLEVVPTDKDSPIYLKSNLLKSNCRHSGLPDWGTAYIAYLPTNKEVSESSLLSYIVSFRNHQEFHEECCERIMYDLLDILQPIWLRVELRYTRRGGLDINPIRVYSRSNEYNYSHNVEYNSFRREFRQ